MTISKLEPRPWKLRHSESEGSKQAARAELIRSLAQETGLSEITIKICVQRGLESAKAIQAFLFPRIETLSSPLSIKDMDRAVARLSKARGEKELVRIFGDYDVDGTTGAALFSWVFREFGFRFEATQPDRFKDGYGLNVKAVEEAAAAGVKLMVTVDCGITSFDAAKRAQELGVDLIIVDHHQIDPAKGLPPALAVVNPQRADCESGLKQLCGCGLAFYVALALRYQGRQEGWWPAGQEPNLKQHLDLVVMATAADMVPLTGDNHILVRHGLEVLRNSRKPGVRALMEVAGLGTRELSPSHLGFVIGPRINASGRMQNAGIALEMLTSQDPARAYQLATDIEKLNKERADTQNQIWDEVRLRVEAGIAAGKYKHGIVVGDPGWHEGVVGIVASRVTETFRRPAAVVALREDYGKGSVRSFAGKDVLSALRACAPVLRSFGGHKHAAGLSVELDKFDELVEAFDQALGAIPEDAEARPLLLEGSCAIQELNVRALEEIEKLGPFGPGNPEPVFSVRAAMRQRSVLKGRHLKMSLRASDDASTYIEAIWFGAAERKEFLADSWLEREAEWACVPELNRFRGSVTPTLRVRDCKPVN